MPPQSDRPQRLPGNPIIRPEMLPGLDGGNINGPSLIRVPPWIRNPLGRYYLYFAHHTGTYIRLAYADRLEGPWTVHAPGVLHLEDAPGCHGHIASPDVLVDDDREQIRLYFHGPVGIGRRQRTFLALSPDGLTFTAGSASLGKPYFRVFRHDHWWYALAKTGLLYRSRDGLGAFEQGASIFPGDPGAIAPGVSRPRHFAVLPEAGVLTVCFSRTGEAPERILGSHIPLVADWREWRATAPEEVLRPEEEWEGAALPVAASASGRSGGRENALRDPALFMDADERRYLLYAVAGESGLAIAEWPSGRQQS